ncbi:hypothetical protein [Reyranella sp.]|uniref:hypothetical protein n=1 Tax=Reyranella sp. TaxID=1929291 RepID=UPI003D0BE1D4
MAHDRAAALQRIKTKNANERAIIEAVDKIVHAMGYCAGLGTTGPTKDDVLLRWTKSLGGGREDEDGLRVSLEREIMDDDFVGEYWLPAWAVTVWVPEATRPGIARWAHHPDNELSRPLISLLEAVESLPEIEAAAMAKYPQLMTRRSEACAMATSDAPISPRQSI